MQRSATFVVQFTEFVILHSEIVLDKDESTRRRGESACAAMCMTESPWLLVWNISAPLSSSSFAIYRFSLNTA
jgi:hypothetical protein